MPENGEDLPASADGGRVELVGLWVGCIGESRCSPSTGAVIGSTMPAPERMRSVPDANVGMKARFRLASVTNQTYPEPAMPLTAAEKRERNESKPPNCFWMAVPRKLESMSLSPVSSDGGC